MRRPALFAVLLATAAPASAAETITYTYDARGRLVQVARSGTVNNGVNASYSYDNADNRTNVTVTGSGGGGAPSFSINDVSATESGNLVFTVTKTGSTTSSYSVNFAAANGSAAAGSDYTTTSGTLTFTTSEATKTASVATIDDTAVESAETVLLNLSGATGGATISDAQGIGTINDNDGAATCNGVSFTVASNAAVTEGANSAFTVTKSGTTSNSCSISYATANGSAAAGSDYTAGSGTLTFTSAQTSQTINVATADDAAVESAETFSISLSSPTGGSTVGTPGSATATINDNDTPAGTSFSINDSGATEGSPVTFTITRSGPTSGSYSVSYVTSDVTAVAGMDYLSASGTVTFGPNETTKTVGVTASSDQITEGNETFAITLHSPTGGATIGNGAGTGTISEDPGQGCYDENGNPILCGPLGVVPSEESETSGDNE